MRAQDALGAEDGGLVGRPSAAPARRTASTRDAATPLPRFSTAVRPACR
ncbi:hypothetical protein [Streptomyces griseoruber]|nr:hypothetical protein [Streptomyces griseoruber]